MIKALDVLSIDGFESYEFLRARVAQDASVMAFKLSKTLSINGLIIDLTETSHSECFVWFILFLWIVQKLKSFFTRKQNILFIKIINLILIKWRSTITVIYAWKLSFFPSIKFSTIAFQNIFVFCLSIHSNLTVSLK